MPYSEGDAEFTTNRMVSNDGLVTMAKTLDMSRSGSNRYRDDESSDPGVSRYVEVGIAETPGGRLSFRICGRS